MNSRPLMMLYVLMLYGAPYLSGECTKSGEKASANIRLSQFDFRSRCSTLELDNSN